MEEAVAGPAVGELLVDEMAFKATFGLVQVSSFARQSPQRQVQPQPVGLRTAFVADAFGIEHLLDPARGQAVSLDEDLPVALCGFPPVPLRR